MGDGLVLVVVDYIKGPLETRKEIKGGVGGSDTGGPKISF